MKVLLSTAQLKQRQATYRLHAFPRRIRTAFRQFDKAALDWGWTKDQGSDAEADLSKVCYEKAKEKLIEAIWLNT